jgi:hypothetical protein
VLTKIFHWNKGQEVALAAPDPTDPQPKQYLQMQECLEAFLQLKKLSLDQWTNLELDYWACHFYSLEQAGFHPPIPDPVPSLPLEVPAELLLYY